ncbi:MAG: hydrogenase iron-sulfur subunit [Deltaproteobacteria bacterium]|nr:hydrogenase iron-sulfur subunit [Deltaproteobacteria bacterium]MBW1948013.1 hydrogenase iron-sulfur subunit [Deltaproteobacteria bacterium]MBW2006952.1 hydrogenase iron-sulfur subunit [Deltaproteobacteria bacterium]MBW2346916.1 hydrogenase iron-sulfur subunit [Deltaproteobacteria bacterium]
MSEFKPRILAFYCANCASSAANVSESMSLGVPAGVKMVQVPCTGRIETLHLLKPFEEGADGVYVAGCQEDSCRYMSGILKAEKRVAQVKRILEELDIEPGRIETFKLSAGKGFRFAEIASEMMKRVQELGPISGG